MTLQRGNSAIIAPLLIFFMFVFHSEIAHAKIYQVGDASGWNLHVSNWTSGKTLKAGDILG
ncbi:putative cupredoxin [Lupinus albus]|uniref:Putative cupredoxin n=1 Tax=Lupinus albus TaxID=3870 RepID=A0A6A4P2C0_LUPAL|nr:putative cupredoxin [Lupinus albus]